MKLFIIDNFNIGRSSDKTIHISDVSIWKQNGIELVFNFKECTHILCFRIDCEIVRSKKPVIILEKYDATSLGINKYTYSCDKVVGIIKNYIPRDKNYLTKPTVHKRLHYKSINDIYDMKHKVDDNSGLSEYLHKIKMSTWDLYFYSHIVHKYMEYISKNVGMHNKIYDIFCVNHEHKNNPILAKHRIKMKTLVLSLKDKFNVITGTGMDPKEFNDNILKSKICIAPYGIGERIATDQRALLAGCILIKPDSDYVLTYPDFYTDKYYVKCKPDFSDLIEICKDVINNTRKYKTRTVSAQKLFAETTKEKYIDRLVKTVKSFDTSGPS